MKKLMLAATALVVVAFTALPAIASATPKMDLPEDPSFTITGPAGVLTGEVPVECESVSGNGEFDATGETGTVQFIFHGCTEGLFGSACTTPGQPTGTIATTEELPFHLKTTTGDNTPAVLITPKEGEGTTGGHFATFECLGGFIEVKVDGNGIIGEITSGYGTSSTFNVRFATNEEGKQTPDHVDETPETTYHLFASINSGEPETVTEDAEGTIHFADNATLTETEE